MEAPGDITHVAGKDDGDPGWSVIELPASETVGFAPSLRCFPRAWEGSPPAWSIESEMQPVRVESLAFTKRFDARAVWTQERNWLLQLLSPDFMTWLAADPQELFGFELHEGTLRCFTPSALDDAAATRFLAEAKVVAERIRAEAAESEGLGVRELGSGISERVERVVAKVSFESPPPDARTASLPYRRFAAREPGPYVAALGGIVALYSVIFGLTFELGADVIGVVIEIFSWIGAKGTGITLAIITVLGWVAAIPEAIAIAARRYGRVAFAREYAKARGLELESPQSFHRRLMRLELPAPAEFVMRGNLPGDREGRLCLLRSGRAFLSSYHDAVVIEAPGLEVEGTDYRTRQGQFVFTRAATADRDAASLDAFAKEAIERLEKIRVRPGNVAG